jgi:hypothetical protein
LTPAASTPISATGPSKRTVAGAGQTQILASSGFLRGSTGGGFLRGSTGGGFLRGSTGGGFLRGSTGGAISPKKSPVPQQAGTGDFLIKTLCGFFFAGIGILMPELQ